MPKEYEKFNDPKFNVFLTELGIINKIKDDANNITLSLQVQDITSQQLAAVNHLIESVQAKLGKLVVNLEGTDIEVRDVGVGEYNMWKLLCISREHTYYIIL